MAAAGRVTGPRALSARAFWLVLPLLVLVVAAFDIPLLMMIGRGFQGRDGFTSTHLREVLSGEAYLDVMATTFRVALVTTVTCALLGYPLAYWISRLQPRRRLAALACVLVPFWISVLVRTYAWIVVLGNAGLVNRALLASGVLEEPLQILYKEAGVIIGTTNVMLPFFVMPVYAAIIKIDGRLLDVAASLGARPATVFWRVLFPMTLPAVLAACVLVFILSLGFFITPAILGGGRVPMISNMLDLFINQMPNWDIASAASTILLAITLLLFGVYLRLTRQETE